MAFSFEAITFLCAVRLVTKTIGHWCSVGLLGFCFGGLVSTENTDAVTHSAACQELYEDAGRQEMHWALLWCWHMGVCQPAAIHTIISCRSLQSKTVIQVLWTISDHREDWPYFLQVVVTTIIDSSSHLSCVAAQGRCIRKSIRWTINRLTRWLVGTRTYSADECRHGKNYCTPPCIDLVVRLITITGDMGGPGATSATVPSSANLGASWFWSRGECQQHNENKVSASA
jgi:hypothetical protein